MPPGSGVTRAAGPIRTKHPFGGAMGVRPRILTFVTFDLAPCAYVEHPSPQTLPRGPRICNTVHFFCDRVRVGVRSLYSDTTSFRLRRGGAGARPARIHTRTPPAPRTRTHTSVLYTAPATNAEIRYTPGADSAQRPPRRRARSHNPESSMPETDNSGVPCDDLVLARLINHSQAIARWSSHARMRAHTHTHTNEYRAPNQRTDGKARR